MKSESPVRAAGTRPEMVLSMIDANGVFQDAVDKVDFQERADHD